MSTRKPDDWALRQAMALHMRIGHSFNTQDGASTARALRAAYRRGQRDELQTVTEIALKSVQLAPKSQRTAIADELRKRSVISTIARDGKVWGYAADIVENWEPK